MSTRFTKRGVPLVESQSLQLIQSASKLNDVVAQYLTQRLAEKGYTALTPSLLGFLSVLECGVNYGSEIARSLSVSRQMVAKTVKELSAMGFLEQKNGVGKQKEIHFSEAGEQLMSDARQLLAEIDEMLFKDCDPEAFTTVIGALNTMILAVSHRQ